MREIATAYALSMQQHGVLGRAQLIARVGQRAAEDVLATDRFRRLHRGVYAASGGAPVAEQAAFAAALRARPAVVTGPVVLHLHGVPGYVGAADFEVLVAPGREPRNVEFRVREDDVPRLGVRRYGDVRVAGPLDALIDSAAFLDRRQERDLRVAWDHLRWNGLAKSRQLERRLVALASVPGAAILARVLEEAGGVRLESEGERALAPVVSCFEPAFEPQVWVTPRRRTDFFSRRCRLGLEYVGKVDHAGVARRLADDERDVELRRDGVRLLYVSAQDLRDPVALLATISGTLTVRAHELGVVPPVAVRPLPTS